jgi:transcriptional regulator with PAS, ATPase and Fis domain
MQQVYERIINAASADVNVLVCGESGVGKELIARTLHQVSLRQAQAFVPVNCASIPETLFEREFFGHRKGSFTGADRDTPGLFDRAHQGVLLLDEVTELTPGMQAKLLRVLQDGEYFPVGSNAPKQVNVLIVAATNKGPQTEIQQGRLRKDFFYRICVIEIDVPPLRERKDDLPLLIEAILEQLRLRQTAVHGQTPPDFPTNQTMLPAELVLALYQYEWPGNVRELQNVLQRYVATGDLSAVFPTLGDSVHMRAPFPPEERSNPRKLPEAVEALERRMIADALTQTGYHIGKTAELLGTPRRTLERKITRYRLKHKNTSK